MNGNAFQQSSKTGKTYLDVKEGSRTNSTRTEKQSLFNKEILEVFIDIWCFQSIPILFPLKLVKI